LNDIREVVKQNMKMILLTIPGERVMMPEFGVGIQELLFENINDELTLNEFRGKIRNQVDLYLPSVLVESIDFYEDEIDNNKIMAHIEYQISSLGILDTLQVP
jgi:phage baseplate assembly protein W